MSLDSCPSGDNFLSPVADVLPIVNHLNEEALAEAEEEPTRLLFPAKFLVIDLQHNHAFSSEALRLRSSVSDDLVSLLAGEHDGAGTAVSEGALRRPHPRTDSHFTDKNAIGDRLAMLDEEILE